ncbi:MAG: type II and III secretion system protein family protein [Armatimonadota bacterium]
MNSLTALDPRPTASRSRYSFPLSGRRVWLVAAGLALLSLLACPPAAAERLVEPVSMAMLRGQSSVLQYAAMRRVAVADAQVADVAVASSKELIIYAKGVGETALYIWDADGFHEISVTVFDVTPVERAAERLRPLLGPSYRFVALSDSTLAVEGVAENEAEAERVAKVLAAAGTDVEVVNLVTPAPAPPPAGPPVKQIASALGDGFRVWAVSDDTVAVEGTAPTAAAAARARGLLAAFQAQTKVVDLIETPDPPAPSVEDERQLLAQALGDGISVRTVGGQAIALEGTLPSVAALDYVTDIVAALDVQAPVLNLLTVAAPDVEQILIRVRVVEVNRQELERLGVNWGHTESVGAAGGPSVQFFDQPFLFGQVSRRGFSQLLDFGAQLDLLEEKNKARVLAQPNLLVNDGEEASILVGGEVPIPVPQAGIAGAAAITVEYKEFGVRMQVEPSIVQADGDAPRIHLKLSPEVSSIDSSSSVTVSGIRVPGFRTRRAQTTVTVAPGDTLAIAGLLQRDVARLVRKVPLLGDLPILGHLFRSKKFVEGYTDLVVMVTPTIYDRLAEDEPL